MNTSNPNLGLFNRNQILEIGEFFQPLPNHQNPKNFKVTKPQKSTTTNNNLNIKNHQNHHHKHTINNNNKNHHRSNHKPTTSVTQKSKQPQIPRNVRIQIHSHNPK
jgi:hypothetical protein